MVTKETYQKNKEKSSRPILQRQKQKQKNERKIRIPEPALYVYFDYTSTGTLSASLDERSIFDTTKLEIKPPFHSPQNR